MKKFLFLVSLPLLLIVFNSCEEDDAQLMFDTIENTAPANIKADYYSVDPSCLPRSYKITTNRLGGELILRCKNANSIYFAPLRDNSRGRYGVTESGEIDKNTLIFEEGNWTVSLIDNNSLKFEFREIPLNEEVHYYEESDYVTISANKDNKELSTSISIQRIIHADYPIN